MSTLHAQFTHTDVHVCALVRLRVQVLSQAQSIAPGESALLVNGLETPDLAYYDTFSLLDSLHAETHTLEALHALGFRVRSRLFPRPRPRPRLLIRVRSPARHRCTLTL